MRKMNLQIAGAVALAIGGQMAAHAAAPTPTQCASATAKLYVAGSSAAQPSFATALANDLSAGGLRLIGDEDFPDQTAVELCFTLPNELVKDVHVEKEIVQTTPRGKTKKKIMVPPEPFHEMTVRGKIVIAFFNRRRRKFAHGVQFVGLDERTQEEIQRFIHVWQIRQLRERAHMRG